MKTMLVLSLPLSAFLAFAQNTWQPTNGPFTLGGAILCLSVDSTHQLFAGTQYVGIFRSSDGGNEWFASGLNGALIVSIASSPNGSVFGAAFDSLYKTTNHGGDWASARIDIPDISMKQVAVDQGGNVFLSTSLGLTTSTDDGLTWSPVDSRFANATIAIGLTGDIFAGADSGVYRSTDAGVHWALVHAAFPNEEIIHLAMGNSGDLFLTTNRIGITFTRGYRSTDQGENWAPFGSGGPSLFPFIAVTPAGHLLIQEYGGYQNLYQSTDNGASWSILALGTNPPFNCFVFPSGGTFLGGSWVGVRKSVDGGVTWQLVGVPGIPATVFALCADSAGNIFAGAGGGSTSGAVAEIYKTADNGQQWTRILSGPVNSAFSSIASAPSGLMFAGSWGGGMFISSNGGTNWTKSNDGLTDSTINSVALDQLGMVYAGTSSGVFRSSDNGQHWNSANEGLSTLAVRVIVAAPSGAIYVGTDPGSVFISSDQGLHWQNHSDGLVGSQVLSMAVNSQGHIFANQGGWGVYRSTDEGTTWVSVAPNLYGPMLSMSINSLDHIFAGAGNGVFRSTDNGENWTLFNSGLPMQVNALVVKSDGVLFGGLANGWVYRTVNSTTSVHEPANSTKRDYTLNQNFPNPFNPSTTICYELPHASRVSLKVYNTLGQEVATLVDENKPAGVYSVEFDGRNLASGVYFYRIQAGSFIQTKKLLLLR